MSSSNSSSSAYNNPDLNLAYETEGERRDLVSNSQDEVDDECERIYVLERN